MCCGSIPEMDECSTLKWSEDKAACIQTASALQNAGTLLMDVYVITKMFDGQMRNVIVHAGDFHIRQYEMR